MACCIRMCVFVCERPYCAVCVCVCPLPSFTSQVLWVSSSLPFLSHSSSSCLVTTEQWKFPIASLSLRMDGPRYLFKLRRKRWSNACVCVRVRISVRAVFIQWAQADKSLLVHPVVHRHWRATGLVKCPVDLKSTKAEKVLSLCLLNMWLWWQSPCHNLSFQTSHH